MKNRTDTISDYSRLSARFAVVRRAWKRAAVLSGLAIVVTEGIGIFTALLLLDWLYQPLPIIRIGLWAAALAAIAYFLARHVAKPLTRKIPDEQIALYIEENRTELDGVLITAAEFGRKRDQIAGKQVVLIDAVVHEAAARSARTQVGHMVDFSRLRKYGFGALAGLAVYAVLSILFPDTFVHHLGRVLQPWHATDEDLARHAAAVAQAEPLRFTFSKGDTSLPRGSSFDFEVTLSKAKPADDAVVLYFRPRTEGATWQKLAMTEIEKLNGFQGALPDVSEDLEFYVACGADKSETHRLTVYDPLIVQSLEMTTHFPDYIKQPDRVEKPSTGDVSALVGSTATLRILTSTELKNGQVKWSDGTTQDVTVDPKANKTATVSFEIKQDATYDYTLTDVNGQQAVSAASLSVHAVPDLPPTIVVKAPQSPVLTHMLGEVNFQAEADDDFGVAGVDLVYSRLDAQGNPQETRLPLTLVAEKGASTHAVLASYRLMLEDIQPPLNENDTVSYHLEARDAKGQTAVSDLGFIIIGYFEHWATWAPPDAGSEVHDDTGADLMAIVALVWELNNNRTHLVPDELHKQSQEIATKMVDGSGNMLEFVTPHMLEHMPMLAKVMQPIALHAKKAHDALVDNDTVTAAAEINVAAALFTGYGILRDASLDHDTTAAAVAGSHFKDPALTMLEQARLNALADAAKDKTHAEEDAAQSEAAAEAAKAIADLMAKQDALIAKAQNMVNAAQTPGSKQGEDGKPMPSTGSAAGAGKEPAPDAQQAANLAAAQHDLADQTRAAATQAQAKAANATDAAKLQDAANKAAAAAKTMEEAARAFAAGKNADGQAKASEARVALQEAGTTLQNNDRDQLQAAIGDAERHVAVLLDKQQDLAADTAKLAAELGTNAPDQRQQRDLQKQAYQQTQLGAAAEALNSELSDLNARATQVGEPEAIRALADAQRAIKHGRPQAKMASAVIDLTDAKPTVAADEQKSAGDALQKVVEGLQAGSDALAASREAQLKRANAAAQDAKKGIDAILGKTGDQHQAGDQQAQAAGQNQGAGQQTQAPGQNQGVGHQAQAPGQNQAAGQEAQADQHGGGQTQNSGQAPGGNDGVRDLAYNLSQLTAAVDNRQLVSQDQVDQLKQMTMDKDALEKKLAVDPKFLHDVSDIVGRISDKIEGEMEATSEAGKLFSSQREECPPSYRQFVNKYFEALSQVQPAPAAGSQQGQP